MKKACLIGYSGHAFVVAELALLNGYRLIGYFDSEEKKYNPFSLKYLGIETQYFSNNKPDKEIDFILSIGDNNIRKKICTSLKHTFIRYAVLQHPKAAVSNLASIEAGSVIMASATINPFTKIGQHVICNTSCVIDHECNIGNFVHIAPAAVLAGNVHVGEGSLIGANSVIRQGIKIGNNVIVGAGSVIINDIPDNAIVYGNPGKIKSVTV